MKEASAFLFEDLHNGKPFFKNQLDLVNQLLGDPDNPYFVDPSDKDLYTRAQSRLKTYISQLLSNTASRSITEDFKAGLIILLAKKNNIGNFEATEIVMSLLESLREKNSRAMRFEHKGTIVDQLNSDLSAALYIAVITSKPLEIDTQAEPNSFSLRKFLFTDLLERLTDMTKNLKHYRFNFPLDNYCYLFWRGLKRILAQYVEKHLNLFLLETLHQKFVLSDDTYRKFKEYKSFGQNDKEVITDEILIYLNKTRHILVFNNSSPIYGMPLIAIDPTDQYNMKIYNLLQDEKKKIDIHKFSQQDSVLWRIFVWDQLKLRKFTGIEVPYSIENT